MNKAKFKYLSQGGITQSDALEYAAWLAENGEIPELPQSFRFENWIETPLPVVYFGRNYAPVVLPFLDLKHQNAVFGIAVGGVLFSKDDVCIDIGQGADWNKVQEYLREKNIELFGEASFGRPQIRVPFLNEMQKALPLRLMFNATINIFREYKLSADNWGMMQYATTAITTQNKCSYVVDMRTGVVSPQVANPRYYYVRPIISGGITTKTLPQTTDGKPNWDQFTEEMYDHLF